MGVVHRAQPGDLILPFAVVAVVGMMIFPLPSGVLDALLMCNISFALALLVSCVYLSQPEKFTSLPTILLLSTLFRLGLNISTTRQILGAGTAPDVIVTFGTFVVRGNTVVGIVVFSIITLVQFLVIAKGAERVAEVAARFTLDAMPGKQMSIDADVRSGILSLLEAKEKRLELQRESKLYGALDGAMKFVKGDAVAGLLITVINMVAGLVVGVSQHGLGLAEAAKKYSLFTIGDGLVSQIPALLVAVAAGIAVTRVEDKDYRFVGREMLGQLTREPQALGTTAGVLVFLSFIPGLPMIPYLAMGGLFAFGAYQVKQSCEQKERARERVGFSPKLFSGIVLRMSMRSALLLQHEQTLPGEIQGLRAELFEQWGIIVPDVQFDIDRTTHEIAVSFHLDGVKMLQVDWVGMDGEKEDGKSGQAATFSETIAKTLRNFLEDHLVELIDDTQTRTLLEVHQAAAEDLINSVVPEQIGVTALTSLLRELVAEEVSVRNMPTILQAVAEYQLQKEEGSVRSERNITPAGDILPSLKSLKAQESEGSTEVMELIAAVRIALKRTISRSVADAGWEIRGWILDAEMDTLLARTAFANIPLDPEIVESILGQMREIRKEETEDRPVVILTSTYARKLLAQIISRECEGVRVIAVSEVCDEADVCVQGRIQSAESMTERENEVSMMGSDLA